MHPPYDLPAPEGGQPFHHEPDEQWANQPLLAVQAEAATAEHHGTWDKAPVGHIPPTLRSPARHHGIWGDARASANHPSAVGSGRPWHLSHPPKSRVPRQQGPESRGKIK
ncbi:uncharacterized protein LOC142776068 [Rhipicephalus microplus]|uniref:uncharacterized protein LOC142776068 n=1 Tax=Rhipicephalus microplus TaxID=6941 RepID=UPI003F6B7880